jgi:Tfp pilus assembly protein PilO
MNKYLARLNPMERRFVVVVAVVVFIVLNVMFVRPHFGDRARFRVQLDQARETLKKFETEIAQTKTYETQIKSLEREGTSVPLEDQAIDFLRTIQSQAAMSGVNIIANSRQPSRTNQFFIEQSQSITVQASEKALVTFLYNLGEGGSMIRVRGLSLRPDPPRQNLSAGVTLVASYQKKPPQRAVPPAATASASKPETPNTKRP